MAINNVLPPEQFIRRRNVASHYKDAIQSKVRAADFERRIVVILTMLWRLINGRILLLLLLLLLLLEAACAVSYFRFHINLLLPLQFHRATFIVCLHHTRHYFQIIRHLFSILGS